MFKLVGAIERSVIETFMAHIETDSAEEAQNTFYQILSEYPNSPLHVTRLLKVNETGERPVAIAIEFMEEELMDPEDEIGVVFDDSTDEDD